LTGWKDNSKVDTLAAAYAEAGAFDEATVREESAIFLAGSTSPDLPDYFLRRAFYQIGVPYHEAPRN
jgi:hypothetical protein